MYKILLIGSGAREHAIAKAIKKSSEPNALSCFASNPNPGIQELSSNYQIGDLTEINDIAEFAEQQKADFAIIGPEASIALGAVDKLAERNIPCIAPTRQLAQIEASKGFTRDLLAKYQIPASPKYKKFSDLTNVKEFLQELEPDFVVKADGLMGGKGVKISSEHLLNHDEALSYCQELLSKKQNFVIEEKLVGQEFSLLSFSDGEHLAHMPPVQDHKRAFDGDLGPNTGGMGSYTDSNHLLPFLNEADIYKAQQFNEATINALKNEFGQLYKGILYGGYMLTQNGIKLIEYNARFGDPEVINLLALLETDFIKICLAILENKLYTIKINFSNKATVCKYLVPEGYPDNPVKNQAIDISKIKDKDQLYYAAINTENNKLYTGSSRTLAVLGIADNILQAEQIAEHMAEQISGPLFHRKDIGTAQLINQKIAQINQLCNTNHQLL